MQSAVLLLLAGAGARPQTQTCVGGQCTRSNGGLSPSSNSQPFGQGFPFGTEGSPFQEGFPFKPQTSGSAHNCQGARCNQQGGTNYGFQNQDNGGSMNPGNGFHNQNCQGPRCNQNCQGARCNQNNGDGMNPGNGFQNQNSGGSVNPGNGFQNQNHGGSVNPPFQEGFPFNPQTLGSTQNCQGAQCNQQDSTNYGFQNQNNGGGGMNPGNGLPNQNNGGSIYPDNGFQNQNHGGGINPDNGFQNQNNGGSMNNGFQNQNNGFHGNTNVGGSEKLYCPAGYSTYSSCAGTHCVVSCDNGSQVEMECPREGVNTDTTNQPDGSSTTTATCGEKFDPPACFPYCGY